MISRTNIVLAVLLAVVLLLAANSRVDYSRPNIEILPDMKYSPAWTTYEANPHFPNGRTLQAPVLGTIARGETPLHYEATKEDAERAGRELLNRYELPASDDNATVENAEAQVSQAEDILANLERSIQRGGNFYRVYCTPCHGSTGLGDGPVAKRGFPPSPPLLRGASRQMPDGQLFHILTYGQGAMPDFAAQLSPDVRWDVINYIRELQGEAPLDAAP